MEEMAQWVVDLPCLQEEPEFSPQHLSVIVQCALET